MKGVIWSFIFLFLAGIMTLNANGFLSAIFIIISVVIYFNSDTDGKGPDRFA